MFLMKPILTTLLNTDFPIPVPNVWPFWSFLSSLKKEKNPLYLSPFSKLCNFVIYYTYYIYYYI